MNKDSHKIIFFNGPRHCGKDTAAGFVFTNFSARVYKMTRPMDKALQAFFDLTACANFRLQPVSPCATNCLARRACPLGQQHAYDARQMQHSYGYSLQALQRWRAGQVDSPGLSAAD